jgi:hypothetical protein
METRCFSLKPISWKICLKTITCLRVACGALPDIRASAISSAVIGVPARRITSTALRNSVPRLNQGLLLLRRFAVMAATLKPRLEHLQDGLDLHHGRFDLDASIPVFRKLARQFGVKLGKREDGLLRFDFGSGHPGKVSEERSNFFWRLRHNIAVFPLTVATRSIGLAPL